MATYTANYGLHQWAPTDPFQRLDFNQDFSKIDAALGSLACGNEAASYHIYNLLLQNDYEGKYTGYKKALLFDGFQNADAIVSQTGFLLGQNCLSLSASGQNSIDLGYGGAVGSDLTSVPMTMVGSGYITGFQYWLYAQIDQNNPIQLHYTLTVNGVEQKCGTVSPTPPAREEESQYTLSLGSFGVKAGDVCTVHLQSATSGVMLRKGSAPDSLGGTLLITAAAADSGSMTAAPALLPAGTGATAWVRYRGGIVGLALKQGGQILDFSIGESRSAVELFSGVSCTEQEFYLNTPLAAGEWQAVITGALGGHESRMDIFDYGIAWW